MSQRKLNGQLVCFHAGELPAVSSGNPLPTEIRICPWEQTQTSKGIISCGASTEALLMQNQKAAKRHPRLALDFEHNTVEGSTHFQPGNAPVAAWGDLEMRPGQGLFLCSLEWTPEGEAHVRGGHARGISPATARNEKGEVIFVHSAGLCRHQEIAELSLDKFSADIVGLINAANTNDMDIKAIILLCNAFLGAAGVEQIPETATIEDVQRLATEGAGKIKDAIAAKKEEKKEDKTDTFSADLTGLREELNAEKKSRLLDNAIRDGKLVVLSADQIKGMTVDAFSAHIGALQSGVVPLDRRTPEKVQTFSADGGMSAEERAIMKQFGISEEDWKKHNA